MNYQPFSALGQGAIFKSLEHPTIPMMKVRQDSAIYLEGVWISGSLYPRGYKVPVAPTTCVDLMTDGEVTLPALRVDPVDPRRKFWKEGDTRWVGDNSRAEIEVFAGLFLYSGMGVGNYFSGVENERFEMGGEEARKKAAEEGIPYVFYDSFRWTNDRKLSRERQEAQKDFDRQQKEKADAAAKAAQPEAEVEA